MSSPLKLLLKLRGPALIFLVMSLCLMGVGFFSFNQFSGAFSSLDYYAASSMCVEPTDDRVLIERVDVVQSKPETKLTGAEKMDDVITFLPEDNYCVPKKLHFIWVGSEIKEKYRASILKFKEDNPDYEVFLWTEIASATLRKNFSDKVTIRNVTEEIENYHSKELYMREPNFGGKSDILRYELIYREGGTYADTDANSVYPLNDLLTWSTVTHLYMGHQDITNGMFSFPKGSKFLEYVIRELHHHYNKDPNKAIPWKSGPPFFTGAFVKYNDTKIHMVNQNYLVYPRSNMSITYHTLDYSWGKK